MYIWIDILHTPQYNFYKNIISRLNREGIHVFITLLDRGRLVTIAKHELAPLDNVEIFVIGRHRLNRTSAIFEANIFRLMSLFVWALNKHIDVAISNGIFTCFIGSLKKFPSYNFGDDPQSFDYWPIIFLSNKSHYCLYKLPDQYKVSRKATILPALKEWSYLAPNVFNPVITALKEYKIEPKEYFFLREVSVGTINYSGQVAGAIKDVAHLIPKNYKVILSLEDKSQKYIYPEDWIILKEPVHDIYSLIYYCRCFVSSGDSMAREAALLGVPSYYLGIRTEMPANKVAAKFGDMQNKESIPFEQWVKQFYKPISLDEKQNQIRKRLNEFFIDINEYLYSLIMKHI